MKKIFAITQLDPWFLAEIEDLILPDRVLGDPDAPVTVIEYASYTCGHCGNFHADQFKKLKAEYIDTGKVRFILATDGQTLEAEDLVEGDIRVCDYPDFANHFGFFLPLAGITTVPL